MVWVTAAWFAAAVPTIAHRQIPLDDRDVKAIFLFNFVQFVEWPSDAFSEPGAPFVIGVLGDDPFGRVLDDVVRGEVVKNRKLIVARYRRVEDVESCHVLFVSSSEVMKQERILAALRKRPILTVGESDRFASGGGMIRFLSDQNRVRLRINLEAATSAGLVISSKLLRPAEIVGGKP